MKTYKNLISHNTKPVAVAILFFIALSMIYLSPALEGKTLRQGDIVQNMGMGKEVRDFRDKTGKEALWTNSMFGGMPAYHISTAYKGNIVKRIFNRMFTFGDWRPFCFIFLYLIGFYIGLLCFKVNPWLAIIGAVAYAFSSYFIIIIEAGHNAKVMALGYLPPIIGGVHLAFKKKYLLGGAIVGLFLALQIAINHLQITYYTLMIVLIFGISELVFHIKNKELPSYFKAVGIMLVFVVLAVLTNFSNTWVTYEYGKYSSRGKSEITVEGDVATSGLNKDYINGWSIGVGETFTLLIPNFKGGASAEQFKEDGEVFNYLRRNQQVAQLVQQGKVRISRYWGDQSFTSPVYFGAIVIFLFVLAFLIVDARFKWWVLIATILSIMLSWGGNFPAFTDLFYHYFPGYNKFRAPSMILIMAGFTMPLLAIIGLSKILNGDIELKELKKKVQLATYIVGGLVLLLIIASGSYSYSGYNDQNLGHQMLAGLREALAQERRSFLVADGFRSLFFILAAALSLYLYSMRKLSLRNAFIVIGVLILIDLWSVDRRYLGKDDFYTKKENKNLFSKTPADQFILQDESEHRVLSLTVNTFNDATTSYYHHSIGGYHGTKMRRYQDLIERKIHPEINQIRTNLSSVEPQEYNAAFNNLNMPVLNMLNTKYVIIHPKAMPLINSNINGNAWFTYNYVIVEDPDEEIAKTGTVNHIQTAIIDKRFAPQLENKTFAIDTNAQITLSHYQPNKLVYNYNSSTQQLVTFSEIYYPKGWNAYIDGNKAEYFRANYILRAMVVPAGEHEIMFEFKPKSYFMGERVSFASSMVLLILAIGIFAFEIRNISKIKTND